VSSPAEDDYYILFPNHHEGLSLYQRLKEAGIGCTIAPTPRAASSFCGISIMVAESQIDKIKQIILQFNIQINGIVSLPHHSIKE
jgi:hypothetical protein